MPTNQRHRTLEAVASCARTIAEAALRGDAAAVAMLPYVIVGLHRALAADLADDPDLFPGFRAELLLQASSLAESGPCQTTVVAGRLLALAAVLRQQLTGPCSPVSPPVPRAT